MKYIAGLCVGIGLGMLMLNSFGSKTNLYQQGFEAGKSYIRDSLIANTDSLIGCSRLGYIPDTISVKQELKNGGSYEIK